MLKTLNKYSCLHLSSSWKTTSVNNKEMYDMLFKKHAPKVLGFIMLYTNNKKEAEEYLVRIFLRVSDNIENIDENTDKKILYYSLCACKPLYEKPQY
jgi:transcription termination factor NusB